MTIKRIGCLMDVPERDVHFCKNVIKNILSVLYFNIDNDVRHTV